MARGELLRRLFLSQQRGNEEEFRAAALEVIAEETKRNNHRLARDLMRILENGTRTPARPHREISRTMPRDAERQTVLVEVRQPERHFSDIILSAEATEVLERVLTELRRSELLRLHGLRPITKLLFCGPPGCGKTLCSEIIATELGIPLLYARFDAIVSSYLGETSANLRKVFDYAASGQWVVLFDEFDAIGKARDDATEHGELKRVVNTFLQLLDSFTSDSIVVAATNHEQMLDPALWRRFDEVLHFPMPTKAEIVELMRLKLRNYPHMGLDMLGAANWLGGMSHADVERVCFDAVKTAILENRDVVDNEIFERAVRRQQSRLGTTAKAATKRQ